MKKKFLAAAAIILIAVSLFSCRKEVVSAANGNNNSPESILMGGKTNIQGKDILNPPVTLYWNVGSFINNGNDVTANFSNLNFQFLSDNLVIVTTGDMSMYAKYVTIYGKWYMTEKDRLLLSFNSFNLPEGNLNDLNGEWKIIKTIVRSMYMKIDELNNQKELRLDMNPKGGSL